MSDVLVDPLLLDFARGPLVPVQGVADAMLADVEAVARIREFADHRLQELQRIRRVLLSDAEDEGGALRVVQQSPVDLRFF